MWVLFALLGLLLGLQSGALAGAVLGGLIGYLLIRQGKLEARLKGVESHLVSMQMNASRISPAEPSQARRTAEPIEIAPSTEPGVETEAEVPSPTESAIPMTEPTLPASEPPGLPDVQGLFARLISGNFLAKLGMVLLFFGIASGLKLAIDHDFFPPWMRLLAAALAGLLAIWVGTAPAVGRDIHPNWLARLAPESEQARRGFGFALEGGGFGILYIATWFAMQQYGYLSPLVAFVLFSGLGLACLILATRQDSQSLAMLGLLGAFLAPLMVPSQGNHIVLFTYLVLLDTFILVTALRRSWHLLTAISLVFTVALSLGWAAHGYRPGLRTHVEIYLIALFLLYTASPVLAARTGPSPQQDWLSATLLFGPPTLAAVIQNTLYPGDTTVLTTSTVLAGLWFGLLGQLTRPSGDRLLYQAQTGMAAVFLLMAPYLAFSRNVANVFWALEGGGLVWYGMRAGRRLPAIVGVLLQLLTGLLLFHHFLQGSDGLPFRDSEFHAGLVLVVAALLSGYAVRDYPVIRRAFLAWALIWWFGIFDAEWRRFLDEATVRTSLLGLAAFTAAVLEWVGRRYTVPDLRAASALLLPAMALALAAAYFDAGHPLASGLWLFFPLALAVHLVVLYRQELDGLDWHTARRHAATYWLVVWALAWEVAWQLAERFPGLGTSFTEAMRALVLAGSLLLVLRSQIDWPFVQHRATYLNGGLALPVLISWFWLFSTATPLTGSWALPYFPLLNPLETAALVLIWSLYAHWQAAGRFGLQQGYPALFGLALLLWLSLVLARIVHHWAGVPYLLHALWHSALLQTLISLCWTGYALIGMVTASRRHVRPVWFAGLGLLLVVCAKLLVVDLANVSGLLRVLSLLGVGLLVLGAGYLAPIPPRRETDQATTMG